MKGDNHSDCDVSSGWSKQSSTLLNENCISIVRPVNEMFLRAEETLWHQLTLIRLVAEIFSESVLFVGWRLHVLIACTPFKDNKYTFCGYVESLHHCLDVRSVIWNPCQAVISLAVGTLVKAMRVVCMRYGREPRDAHSHTHTQTKKQPSQANHIALAGKLW